MNYPVTENPSDEIIEGIQAGLQNHNRPFLENIDRTVISAHSESEDGSITYGIVGEVWGSWLSVKYLFVSPSEKSKGIGSKLLARLEEKALSLGAKQSVLETFSFQAKSFYEKNGYLLQMTLEDYPETDQLHYLTKVLYYSNAQTNKGTTIE